jgi:hypothetical protein
MAMPSGWPAELPEPGSPDWERHAVAWLFDQCPADYRGYDVFRRHPVVLAHLAKGCLAAAVEAAEVGLRTARHDLREAVGPETVDAAVAAYERERHRLKAASVGADLIWRALRGERWVERLR